MFDIPKKNYASGKGIWDIIDDPLNCHDYLQKQKDSWEIHSNKQAGLAL